MTNLRLLLCTDLDRTLLPNGDQPESKDARDLFLRLVSHEHVILVFVTGRHKALVDQALDSYNLPQPNFVITDVGTRIYHLENHAWINWEHWESEIAPDWRNWSWTDINRLLADLPVLQLQEKEKQNRFKLSYYVPLNADQINLNNSIHNRLLKENVAPQIIWSVDEQKNVGLLDIIPAHAGKLQAIRYLQQNQGYHLNETVFAGDSGNDLAVLTSELPAVLVKNAAESVREQALEDATAAGTLEQIYLARGGFMGMNGNYSAGIVEGVIHYRPDLASWLSNSG